MALRTMREIGDEILNKRSKEVKKLSRRDLYLIEDMLDTMYEREGAGLAAPQVGVLKRIVVLRGGLEELENEEVTNEEMASEEVRSEEGICEVGIPEREVPQEEVCKEVVCEKVEDKGATCELEEEEMEEADPIILINPVIVKEEGSQTGEEGCLSVPGKWGVVTRPHKVTIRALDINMEEFELEGEGLLARAICHEIDHLDGKLYVDLVEGELRDVEDRDEEVKSS